MNTPACCFQKTIRHFGTLSFSCQRKAYNHGMCILHVAKNADAIASQAEDQKIAADFEATLREEIEIARTAAPDHVIDWQGIRFPALKFDKWVFPRKLLLTAARFEHGATFKQCVFEREVEAIQTDFIGSARTSEFTECTFKEKANFWSSSFGDTPKFIKCIFQSTAQFQACKLRSPDFSDSHFLGTTQFAMATFSGMCDFKLCLFKGEIDFLSIQADNDASLDFRASSFSGQFKLGADRRGMDALSFAELDFSRITVLEKTSLEFQDFEAPTAYFSDTLLSEGANLRFEEITFGRANFSDMIQREKTTVGFFKTPLNNAVFLNTNVEKFNFIDVTWHLIEGRQGLISEVELNNEISNLSVDKKINANTHAELVRKVELNSENYRQLVKNHEAKRNFSLAENFHIGEMEMQRKKGAIHGARHTGMRRKLTSWNDFSIYFALSKYGTSYLHSIKVLVGLLLLLASLFLLCGLRKSECLTPASPEHAACRIQYTLYGPDLIPGLHSSRSP